MASERCVAAFEAMYFSVRSFGCALFLFLEVESMKKRILCLGLSMLFVLTMLVGCSSNKCGMCHGSGYYNKKTCPACHGSGYSDYDPYDQYKHIW